MKRLGRCVVTMAGLLVLGIAVPPAQATLITFDELPPQPVDGLAFQGVAFSFTIAGVPSTDATFNAPGPTTSILTSPLLEGNAAGILTFDFDQPTSLVEFSVGLNTEERLDVGYT